MASHPLFGRRSKPAAFDPFPGLFEHTVKHGGATVESSSGQHYDPSKGGYAVGMRDKTLARVSVNARPAKHRAAAAKAARYPGATHFGTWLNEGRIHYDPVQIFDDVDTAKAVGAKRHQKAIYDFKNDKEIPL